MLKISDGYHFIKIGFFKKISTFYGGKNGMGLGNTVKVCSLLLDRRLSPLKIQRIQEWFYQNPISEARILPLSELREFVGARPLSLNDLEAVAVSPSFKDNFLEGGILRLNLNEVLKKVERFEDKKREHISHNEARTVFLNEGADVPQSKGGTLYQTNFVSTVGGLLMKRSAETMFPINPNDIFNRDNFGFYDWMVDNVGRKPEVIGTFALEFAILRQMFLRKEVGLDSFVFFNVARAFKEAKGYWMKLELLKTKAGYLDEYELQLQKNVYKKCGDIYLSLLKKNTSGEGVTNLAVLSLLVSLNMIEKGRVVAHVSGKIFDRELNARLKEIENYLASDEGRLFSLKLVVDIIKTI